MIIHSPNAERGPKFAAYKWISKENPQPKRRPWTEICCVRLDFIENPQPNRGNVDRNLLRTTGIKENLYPTRRPIRKYPAAERRQNQHPNSRPVGGVGVVVVTVARKESRICRQKLRSHPPHPNITLFAESSRHTHSIGNSFCDLLDGSIRNSQWNRSEGRGLLFDEL